MLCVLFKNGFNESFTIPRMTPKVVKEKVTEIVLNLEINLEIEMKRKKLSDTFNRVDGTFVKKTGYVYSIAHDKRYDMIAVTCGQHLVELFIKYGPTSFIAEKLRLVSFQIKMIHFFIYLRILRVSTSTEYSEIFRNKKERQQVIETRFQDTVMEYIEQHLEFCTKLFAFKPDLLCTVHVVVVILKL